MVAECCSLLLRGPSGLRRASWAGESTQFSFLGFRVCGSGFMALGLGLGFMALGSIFLDFRVQV